MKVTGTLTIVKGAKKGPHGYEMKVSGLKFYSDNPYFTRAGVDAHDFLLKLEEPPVDKNAVDSKLSDARRTALLAEGTVQTVPFVGEYTSSGTLDLKLIPPAKKVTKEDLDAQAELVVRTNRTPDGQPADTLPVDHKSKEFKAALAEATKNAKASESGKVVVVKTKATKVKPKPKPKFKGMS